MSVVLKTGDVIFGPDRMPEIARVNTVRRFDSRDAALRYLQQYPEQLDDTWFIAAWHAGRGLGWLVARAGWIQE